MHECTVLASRMAARGQALQLLGARRAPYPPRALVARASRPKQALFCGNRDFERFPHFSRFSGDLREKVPYSRERSACGSPFSHFSRTRTRGFLPPVAPVFALFTEISRVLHFSEALFARYCKIWAFEKYSERNISLPLFPKRRSVRLRQLRKFPEFPKRPKMSIFYAKTGATARRAAKKPDLRKGDPARPQLSRRKLLLARILRVVF